MNTSQDPLFRSSSGKISSCKDTAENNPNSVPIGTQVQRHRFNIRLSNFDLQFRRINSRLRKENHTKWKIMNDTMVENEQLTINNINSIGEKMRGTCQADGQQVSNKPRLYAGCISSTHRHAIANSFFLSPANIFSISPTSFLVVRSRSN